MKNHGLLLFLLAFLVPISLYSQPFTRQEIIDTAYQYRWVHWEPDSLNTTFWADTYYVYGAAVYDDQGNLIAKEHRECDFYDGFAYNGIAYGYGQEETYSEFLYWLENHIGAGNHKCHYLNYGQATGEYPPPWATGIDCSAFVSWCWQLNRHYSTSELANMGYSVNVSAVQQGDIIVKPNYHVYLVDCVLGNFIYVYHASGKWPYTVTDASITFDDVKPENGWVARSLWGTGIPEPNIRVTYPNGGETWIIGETYTITWNHESVLRLKNEKGV